MAAVQVSARIDSKTKKIAEEVFGEYGLDISSAIRSMVTITARTRKMPFVIGATPLKQVSLNGDEFESDTEYFKQIPGYWESILEACEEPEGVGVIYDPDNPKAFWDSLEGDTNVDN